MGLTTTGHVLRGVNVSPTNAVNSAEPDTGVVRCPKPVPNSYALQPGDPLGAPPVFVDAAADQYRAAILEAPGTTPIEYLVWAQNTANLAWVDDPSWWSEQGYGVIPPGTRTVVDLQAGVGDPPITDGADHFLVRDDGNRDLGTILYVVLARGDTEYDDEGWVDENDPGLGRKGDAPYLWWEVLSWNQSPAAGVVELSDAQLTLLGGGLSRQRGDLVVTVRYTVAPSRFWWTRNDRYETRFGWNGRTQRWEPYKGSAAKSLGLLLLGTTYQFDPRITNLPVGAYLPGDASNWDSYSMVRVGNSPGSASQPVPDIRVKSDSEISTFDFSSEPTLNGVMGQTSGELRFSPAFAAQHAGKTIWYSYKGFSKNADGFVGGMRRAAVDLLYIAPIPGPTDHPLVKFGNRAYLTPTLVATDAALEGAADPISGSVLVSLSTGRLRFSPEDLQKADPDAVSFDKSFLGESVIYDGVALNAVPQPTRAPVRLVDALGDPATAASDELYLPDSVPLPGLGVSGVLDAPDGTGALPDLLGVEASLRPGGDTLEAANTGRVRQISDGVGDSILFSRAGAILNLQEVDLETDLPSMGFKVEASTAYVARERGSWGSRVVLGKADRKRFGTDPVYFLQSSLNPAVYTTQSVLYSRNRDIFRFTGDEHFFFAVDSGVYEWTPVALISVDPTRTYYTAAEVAASIQQDTLPALLPGTTTEVMGRVAIRGITSVEIGFGTGGEKDLSGCAALGFLPGWRVVEGVENWVSDSGVSLGLFRSPVNLDRSTSVPDYMARDRIEDFLLIDGVQASPYVFLDNVPLQDVSGIDEGVFFALTTTFSDGESSFTFQRPLRHYEDIIHRFGQRKFEWAQRDTVIGAVDRQTTTLTFGVANLVPESFLNVPSISSGLMVSEEGGFYVPQDPDSDFVLAQGGASGTATLIARFGRRVTSGAKGTCDIGSHVFADPSALFVSRNVHPGYRLKIMSGGNAGSYVIRNVFFETAVSVDPAFPETNASPLTWEIYSGYEGSVYDPSLVADMSYKEFNHLPTEPFQIRVLSRAGSVPASVAASLLDVPRADVSEALQRDREILLRFGTSPTAAHEATPRLLGKKHLGILANGSLNIPDMDEVHVTAVRFYIQVGQRGYYHDSSLYGVTTFTYDADRIEYLTQDAVINGVRIPRGRLQFGSAVLSSMSGSEVYYAELLLYPSSLTIGTAEIDPSTGHIGLSAGDITQYANQPLYVAEKLVTENRRDVSINPMAGSFSPNVPVPVGSLVEASYWRADLEGRKIGDPITEFLPVFVRKAPTIRIGPNLYRFNDAGYTVDQRIEPSIWIGAMMQNFGRVDCVIDYPADWNGAGRILFTGKQVEETAVVTVTYAVFEAQGGERAFETSQKNVYRPPFYIKANQSQFGLRGNRVSEFQPGQMLRLGEDCFYIKSLLYYPPTADGKGDVTAVGIYPPTVTEVGSRAPGNDILALITSGPITTIVDPDGASPVVTSAPAGFMSPVEVSDFPFEPVVRGQKTIIFRGDLTSFAVAGHILELGGCPYTIASSELTPDGSRTNITVTGGFIRGVSVTENPTIKLSYRPVYPPETREFIGVGPVYDAESLELVLFGEESPEGTELPGRSLIPDVEFRVSPYSGAVELLAPVQKALGPSQKLFLSFTRLRALQPTMQDQVLQLPRYTADFLHVVSPSSENGLLGARVTASYTFSSPDSFYFRAVRVSQYMGEVAQDAIQEITAKQPAGGAFKLPAGGTDNWDQGRVGLRAERKNLLDVDRAARLFLEFYNNAVVTFEQVQETISGGFIGDRNGKFRFWIGHGRDYPTPGYEDNITGVLQPRSIWTDVVNADRAADLPVFTGPSDWVVVPDSIELVASEIDGTFLSPDKLAEMLARQGEYVRNDVDDLVMLQLGKVQVDRSSTAPYFRFKAKGVYGRMVASHQFSRLFPTRTKAFFRMFPGAGAQPGEGTAFNPGVYTAGREINGEWARTTGMQIGQVGNPVHGDLTQISTATLGLRRARARVWGYFPNGIPAGVFSAGTSVAITEPCLIASPLLLREVPINPETGYPDDSLFLSQSATGTVPDAVTGDPELAVPGLQTGDQISWGKPDGRILGAATPTTATLWGTTTNKSVFIRDILYGCVLRLQDSSGVAISAPEDLLVVETPAHEAGLGRGDSVLAISPTGTEIVPAPSLSDNPTFQTFSDMAARIEAYRNGFDLDIKTDGRVLDRTLPSKNDPVFYALKELFGQNPPDPMSAVEGPVEFVYDSQNPLVIPALTGAWTDDSGDYSIPYLKTGNTEIEQFGEISITTAQAVSARTGNVPPTFAVYPEEIVALDGAVASGGSDPAALVTASNLAPAPPGSTTPGEGFVRPFDFVLVQSPGLAEPSKFTASGGATLGPHGVFSVGSVVAGVGGSILEPPRFVTHTAAPSPGATSTGDGVNYVLDNAMVFVQGPYPADPQSEAIPPPGVQAFEAGGITVLDFGSTTIALNNGETDALGNLNDVLASGASITLRMIARPDSVVQFGPPGVNPLPNATGGVEALRLRFVGGQVHVWTYQDDPNAPAPVVLNPPTPTLFGTHTGIVPVVQARQIHIPILGVIPWAPMILPPGWATNKWFLPYTAGPNTMLYGFEYVFDIDASSFLSDTAWIEDDRLTFHDVYDLSFAGERGATHSLNPALSLETKLMVTGVPVGRTTASHYVSTVNTFSNGLTGLTPNPFTFLPRGGGTAVGDWTPRVGPATERGSLKVMAFEGWDNDPITASDVVFSTLPSCDYPEGSTTPICLGVGVTGSRYNTSFLISADAERLEHRITDVTLSAGSLGQIQSGDVAVITGSSNPSHPGSVHVGTYLVRHAVEPTGATSYREVAPTATAGVEDGFLPIQFPAVLAYAPGPSFQLQISDLAPAKGGPLVGSVNSGFPAAPARIYVIRNLADLASTDAGKFSQAVISAEYSGVTESSGTGVFTLTPGTFRDAAGNLLGSAAFASLVHEGQLVSGMKFLPVRVGGSSYGLPTNNVVGYDAGGSSVYGFRRLTLTPPLELRLFMSPVQNAQPLVFKAAAAAGASDGTLSKVAAANNVIPLVTLNPPPSHEFYSAEAEEIYHWVTHTLDLRQISNPNWSKMNSPTGSAGVGAGLIDCILPGTRFDLRGPDGGGVLQPGFRAQAGVFLQPSVPRSGVGLVPSLSHVRVVDLEHSLPDPTLLADYDREIGMRNGDEYYTSGAAPEIGEEVTFAIRRIRRFHDVGASLVNLQPLRFTYEIRRGLITGITQQVKQTTMVFATRFTMNWETIKPAGAPKAPDVWNDGGTYSGTNLGGFLSGDVNIHPGDLFRLLDKDGMCVEQIEIQTVLSQGSLLLAAPGIRKYSVANGTTRFEIWLRRAPVPHEQSNEQLLELITDRSVYRTSAAWGQASELGGYVPQVTGVVTYGDAVNRLYDDLRAPGSGQTFAALGVRKGDIVVIDPLGAIPRGSGGTPAAQEASSGPFGDESVPGRVDHAAAPVYTAGRPSPLDDNRGFYRVLKVVDTENPPYLLVNPVNSFAGTAVDPVIFDASDNTRAYVVYPTVNDSSLSGDQTESQMALRPTRARNPVTGSFKSYDDGLNKHSIRPFSYQVIRPTSVFEPETIDLVLMNRERTLSLIETLRMVGGTKGGSYFTFQRFAHLYDVGSPTNPILGLGVASNAYLMGFVGRVDVMPYANNAACLSLLDRRFWILDEQLDSLTYDSSSGVGMRRSGPGDTPYTEFTTLSGSLVRPVLPDLIDEVLDVTEKLRSFRYVWLAYRTHTLLGTLASIQRFDEELPARMQEQMEYLLLNTTLEKT